MLIDVLRSFKSKLMSSLNSTDKRSKIQDSDFIIGLLLAVSRAKENFTLSDLRLAVCHYLGITVGASAFNERIGTSKLAKNLRATLESLIRSSASRLSSNAATALAGKLGVTDIQGIDASMVTLWDGLSAHFKGTFMEAAAKLHLSVNLVTGAVCWFDITPGYTHDSQRFPHLHEGCLYIFDLGYWSTKLFEEMKEAKASFLSRIKGSAKFTVTKVIYGTGNKIIGHDILSFPFHRKRKKIVELLAVASNGGTSTEFRLLGFWDKKVRSYRWYVTNLRAPRHLIYDLYRLRWQIELSFKAMKSTLNFDRIPTLQPKAVESFILIALINYVFSVIVREDAENHADKTNSSNAKTSSIQKAAKIFSEISWDILEALKIGKRITAIWSRRLMAIIEPLLRSIFDPNHKRRKNTVNRLLVG